MLTEILLKALPTVFGGLALFIFGMTKKEDAIAESVLTFAGRPSGESKRRNRRLTHIPHQGIMVSR